MLLAPRRDSGRAAALDPELDLVLPTTREEAFAWFDSEQPNNLAVLRAAAGRADGLLWLYVWSTADYLDFRGGPGYMESETLALEAAVRLGDLRKQAQTAARPRARPHGAAGVGRRDPAARAGARDRRRARRRGGDRARFAESGPGDDRLGEHRRAIEKTSRALRIYERPVRSTRGRPR